MSNSSISEVTHIRISVYSKEKHIGSISGYASSGMLLCTIDANDDDGFDRMNEDLRSLLREYESREIPVYYRDGDNHIQPLYYETEGIYEAAIVAQTANGIGRPTPWMLANNYLYQNSGRNHS